MNYWTNWQKQEPKLLHIDKLAERLLHELPGHSAHKIMASRTRSFEFLDENVKDAAVLIAIFEENGSWKIPLIKRVEDGKIHSGQIAFPGGKIEDGESVIEAAIREANEEIGIRIEDVEIIGTLSELVIPVSSYRVIPVIGKMKGGQKFKKNPDEVQEIVIIEMDELKKKEVIKSEERTFNGVKVKIPFYEMNKEKIWGATAMILSELMQILDED